MLPHITNSQAGRNLWDPVHVNIFEVAFTIPEALRAEFGQDEAILTEHVTKISGLDALHKGPEVSQQKFMGTDRSYIDPKMDSTHAELEVTFTLNLRNETDNYIYKLFKAWTFLGYDIRTGQRHLKKDYCSQWLRASQANRNGDIIKDVVFKDVMISGGITNFGEFNYDTSDALEITVKFVSDWWTDVDA